MITDIRRIVTELAQAQVTFVVIGGVAASTHGSAQVTFDVDICYRRDADNIERLCQALEPFHPRLRNVPADVPFRLDPATVSAGLNFSLTTDIGDLDLLDEVAGLGEYQNVSAHAQRLDLFGYPVEVLSLEGLIKARRATGRQRDVLSIPELEALLEMEQERERKT